MFRVDRINSLRTLWMFLSCLHEHIQRRHLIWMENQSKYNLIRSLIERDIEHVHSSNQLMNSTKKSELKFVEFEKLISKSQGFLEDDNNIRFLDVRNPKIGCQNFEIYKDQSGNAIDLDKRIVTPVNKIDFASKSFSSGSCLTCVRDLNKNDVHHEIRVLKSKNLIRPKCVFYPTENRQRLEVNIVLNASVTGSVVYVRDIEVTSSLDIKTKIINDMKLRNINDEMLTDFFKSWRVNERLRDTWIQINGLGRTTRENAGVFATMEKRGFSSLIQTNSSKDLKGMPKLIHILSEVLFAVCSGWNPLRLSDLSDVMSRSIYDLNLLEKIRSSLPVTEDASKDYWPLKKIALSPSTMEHLLSNAQTIKYVNPSIRINQFVEDSDLDNKSAKLYLDKIALWRC